MLRQKKTFEEREAKLNEEITKLNEEIKNIKADSIKNEKQIKIKYGKQIKEIQDKLTISQNELDEEKNKRSSLETDNQKLAAKYAKSQQLFKEAQEQITNAKSRYNDGKCVTLL